MTFLIYCLYILVAPYLYHLLGVPSASASASFLLSITVPFPASLTRIVPLLPQHANFIFGYSFYLLIFKILLFAVSFICLLVIPSAVLNDLFDVLFITLLLFAFSLPVYDLPSLNLPLFMVGPI